MNKFLRFFFWLIFIVAAAIVALAFIEPNDVTVSRSVVISAPKEQLFEQIVNFKNWSNWSGFLHQKDTGMKVTYSGDDGKPGSTYHWAGSDRINGTGEIKNENVEGTAMHYSFKLEQPGEMLADGVISVKDSAGHSKVTWTFHKHFPFLANAVLLVFNLDKYIGGDLDVALNNLKQFAERNVAPAAAVQVTETDYPSHLFAGIRQAVEMKDIGKFFSDNYAPLRTALAGRIIGDLSGIYYAWDTAGKRAEIMIAFPVKDTTVQVKDGMYVYLEPSVAYMAVSRGGYAKLTAVHAALDKFMQSKGKSDALKIEEYPIGPMQEPDSNKWVTNVYYLPH